jgi:hypothetical protein
MIKWPQLERNHRLPDSERARVAGELLKSYEAGKSIRELCAESGYSIGRVRRLLIEAGVNFRARGGPRRRPRT